MNSESHNPDMILEYFQSLKEWKKSQFKLSTSSEIVQLDKKLVRRREDLEKLRLSITSGSNSIAAIRSEINRVNQNIGSIEKEMSELSNRIDLVKREYLSVSSYINSNKTVEKSFDNSNELIPNQKIAGKFRLVFSIIGNDIEAIYLDLRRALSHYDIQILLQYILGLFIGLIFLINFPTFIVKLLSLLFLSLYLIWRIRFVFKFKKQSFNGQTSQHKESNNTSISEMRHKQRSLEVTIGKLQSQLNGCKGAIGQYRTNQKDLIISLGKANKHVLYLNDLLDKEIETYRTTEESVIEQICAEKINRLLYLESLFEKWFKEYIADLTKKAQRKLCLADIEVDDDPMALKAKPITVWVGVTERTSPSLIVKDSLTEEIGIDKISELHINPEEFESQDPYEGTKRKYGVYEFLAIFLCENFLIYYKCYFNFIRRKPVNEEYSEYLYENIVFTKSQEKSSVNMKNFDDSKQVYSKILTISTNDGKVLCFRIPKDRGGSNPSEIDHAAVTIRNLLRQRQQDLLRQRQQNDPN